MLLDLKDKIPFGKYKGQTIASIIAHDPQYIYWVCENISWFALTTRAQDKLPDRKSIILYEEAKRACSDMRGLNRILDGGPTGEYAQLTLEGESFYNTDDTDDIY